MGLWELMTHILVGKELMAVHPGNVMRKSPNSITLPTSCNMARGNVMLLGDFLITGQ